MLNEVVTVEADEEELGLLFGFVALVGRIVSIATVTTLVVESTCGPSTATRLVEVDADTFGKVRLRTARGSGARAIGDKTRSGTSYRMRLEVLVRDTFQLIPVVDIEVFFRGRGSEFFIEEEDRVIRVGAALLSQEFSITEVTLQGVC